MINDPDKLESYILEPCLFCGVKPVIYKNHVEVNILGCKYDTCRLMPSIEVLTLEEAVKMWNEGVRKGRDLNYDCTADTLKHIKRVNELLILAAQEVLLRATRHDDSKLSLAEKKTFDKFTPKLKGSTYDSEEYKGYLKEMELALSHHYQNNSHHPEHYPDGINHFDLFDLIEMLFDWKAATERHADGDIMKSIEKNTKRFGMSDQLAKILRNTVNRYLIQEKK